MMLRTARIARRQRERKRTARREAFYAGLIIILLLAYFFWLLLSGTSVELNASSPFLIVSVLASAIGLGGLIYIGTSIIQKVGSGTPRTIDRQQASKTDERDNKYKSLIQHALDVITIVDHKGVVKYASPSTERILGYNPDTLIGQRIYELIHSEDHPLMGNALQQKTTFFFSFRMQHHDGTWLWFESAGTNMVQDELIQGYVLTSRDITDRKREEELKRQKEMTAIKLQTQKENAEREKQIIEKANEKLEESNRIIKHKNDEINDSITYAFRIQTAMLPDISTVRRTVPDSFIYWKPKDIVSGDFYWYHHENDMTFIAAADCTGHGVPGAFMTMIGNTLLNQVVKQQNYTMPEDILEHLHIAVRRALRQDQEGSQSRDGMDISFCVVDHKNNKLHWAGANNPLLVVQDGDFEEFKADKVAIGGTQHEDERKFTRQTIDMQPNHTYYFYTDGYQDQFGGDKGRKFMTKKFKKYLTEISEQDMDTQAQLLDDTLKEWMGFNPSRSEEEGQYEYEQVDDILVIGMRAKTLV